MSGWEEVWVCSECGEAAVDGPVEEEVDDERLAGAIGEVIYRCPACGASDYGLG